MIKEITVTNQNTIIPDFIINQNLRDILNKKAT